MKIVDETKKDILKLLLIPIVLFALFLFIAGVKNIFQVEITEPEIQIEKTQAKLDQAHYRWRNDDGDKILATWASDEDNSFLNLDRHTTLRLRVQIVNRGQQASSGVRYQLEYATDTNGPWYSVGPSNSQTAHWVLWDSQYFIDGAPTTNLVSGLTDSATTFVSGDMKDIENETNAIILPPDSFTEIEYAIRATSTSRSDVIYYFRMAKSSIPLDDYSVYNGGEDAKSGVASSSISAEDSMPWWRFGF